MANISEDKATDSKLKTIKLKKSVSKTSTKTSSTNPSKKKQVKKSTKKTKTTRKITKTSKKMKQKETGEIKEASIAKFMRKRTQLVGFDYGNFKHTQYAVEFTDNALDAIEKFQWDSTTAYMDIQYHMDQASDEFKEFADDVQKLKIIVEKQVASNKKPTKDTIIKLSNLYQQKPKIFQKIIDVYNEYGDHIEEIVPYEPKTITISNFNEEFKKFESEIDETEIIYDDIKKEITKIKYSNIKKEVEDLNKNPKFMFTMDKAISFENLKYKKNSESKPVKIKLKNYLGENSENDSLFTSEIDTSDHTQVSINNPDMQTPRTDSIRETPNSKKKEEDAIRVLRDCIDDFLTPVMEIINNEPMVIIKLQEEETPEVLWEKGERADSLLYTFEIFDNGTGMTLPDFKKFGKYLASSKSQKLRQTRGSQGFGSPSAFSDAQNTTGKPIVVISKHSSDNEGICSEFYTTENNTKEYIIKPTEIEVLFLHGTFIKLSYLNKKYTRGYVDSYVEKTAMMNPHVTFIYIDPYNKEHSFPRKIDKFPNEPKFALPHPSSIKIGEFQDLLRSSQKLTVTAFLADSFVRMNNILAKLIVSEAEFELEQELNVLSFDIGFISVMVNQNDKLFFMREEKKISGRSTKPRLVKIVYEIFDEDFKSIVWSHIEIYNKNLKNKESFEIKQRNIDKSLKKESTRKELKEKQKEIKVLDKSIEKEVKSMGIVKTNIKKLLLKATFDHEIENNKIKEKMFNIVRDLKISKTKPSDLSQNQTEFLYMAFKDKKYKAPPTDTAIAIGKKALETAIIKHYNLTISNRIDFFGDSKKKISQMINNERLNVINKILSKFNDQQLFLSDRIKKIEDFDENQDRNIYSDMILDLDLVHTIGDDFVTAETRAPTSGKGLAFVVEAVMAYSPLRKDLNGEKQQTNISFAKKASSVVTRYVNRTPKMRDNSDCALWMGVQNVNWKNYKVSSTFDNGIPKGPYAIFINCSGPYTHLMFKSQSKNALAEDEILLKEVKLCLESIGRSLKRYHNKQEIRERRKKKSELIEKNIPQFIESLHNIAKVDPKYKNLKKSTLVEKIMSALESESDPRLSESQISKQKKQIPHKKLSALISSKEKSETQIRQDISIEKDLKPKVEQKSITKKLPENEVMERKLEEEKKTSPEKKSIKKISKGMKKSSKFKKKTGQLPLDSYTLTNDGIINELADNNWYSTSELVKKLHITSLIDARFLQVKLKNLVLKGIIEEGKNKKKVWKIKE